MVPPHPAPDLVMSQASFALGPFQRRFDPGPMGPHLNQLAQSDLKRRIAQSVIDPGMCLDGPHHDQPLFRADPSFMLGLDPDAHRLDFQRPFLAVARHQADPAGGALPCSPCIGTNEGDLTFPTDAGFPARGPASLQITDLGIARDVQEVPLAARTQIRPKFRRPAQLIVADDPTMGQQRSTPLQEIRSNLGGTLIPRPTRSGASRPRQAITPPRCCVTRGPGARLPRQARMVWSNGYRNPALQGDPDLLRLLDLPHPEADF